MNSSCPLPLPSASTLPLLCLAIVIIVIATPKTSELPKLVHNTEPKIVCVCVCVCSSLLLLVRLTGLVKKNKTKKTQHCEAWLESEYGSQIPDKDGAFLPFQQMVELKFISCWFVSHKVNQIWKKFPSPSIKAHPLFCEIMTPCKV